MPWWAAILTAVTAPAIGFAFDAGSGNKELTHVFAALYVLGCVTAVLTVQQSGVFTAVIQPPLVLFVTVPGAYWLFHGATFPGLKNILINCGYPLIERFPLMLFTSAGVLLIGLVRWYIGMATRSAAGGERTTGLAAKLTSMWGRRRNDDDSDDDRAPAKTPRRRPTERPARATRSARGAGASKAATAKRATPTRSRPVRPSREDAAQPAAERPRRREYDRDVDAPAEVRRRPREPRDGRRDPHLHKDGPARRSRVEAYEPGEPGEPPRRRQPAANGINSTHHPVSRVRYRGTADGNPPPRKSEPESWQYDI